MRIHWQYRNKRSKTILTVIERKHNPYKSTCKISTAYTIFCKLPMLLNECVKSAAENQTSIKAEQRIKY